MKQLRCRLHPRDYERGCRECELVTLTRSIEVALTRAERGPGKATAHQTAAREAVRSAAPTWEPMGRGLGDIDSWRDESQATK